MTPTRILLMFFLVVLAAESRAATIVPTGNGRHAVRALAAWNDGETIVQEDPRVDSTAAFPFDEALEAEVSTVGVHATGDGELSTSLGPRHFEASGTAAGRAQSIYDVYATGGGDAYFRFEFMVDEATPYNLSIRLEASSSHPGFSVTQVTFIQGHSGPAFTLWDGGIETHELSGVFQPGVFYSLTGLSDVTARVGDPGDPLFKLGSADFHVTLTIPEPGASVFLLPALVVVALRAPRGGDPRLSPRERPA